MRRTLTTLILVVAGVRLVLAYAPPAGDVGTIDGSPSPSPDGSPAPDASASAAPTATPAASAGASATPKPTATPTPASGGTATLHNGTFTGSKFNYTYGTMQVTVVIKGGSVSSATVSQSGRWDIGYQSARCTAEVFNGVAVGLAADRAAGATFQSSQPSMCSGATYSWWGYANSLQSAIDKATY
jgi:uncharacterized protein with FMN-binding domain